MAVGQPAQPQLAAEPVRDEPLGVAKEASVPWQRDRARRGSAVDLQPGSSLDDQARGGEHSGLDGPGCERPLPNQPAGSRERQDAAVLEHRGVAARVRAQVDDPVRRREREAPRPVRGEDDDRPPGRVGKRPFPDAAEDDRRRPVHVRREEREPLRLRETALRPEGPVANVPAGVGQPERAALRRDHAGDAAARARADEAVARESPVAPGGDVPEPHFVAAALVLVRVGDIGAGDGDARDRPRDLPLARRCGAGSRYDRKKESESEDPAHRADAIARLLVRREVGVKK